MVEDVCETTGFLFWGPNETRKEVFPTKTLYDFLFSFILATYSAHLHLNNRWQRVQLMKPSLCSFFQSLDNSSLLCPNVLSTLFSKTPCLGSALNVRDHISYPHKVTDIVIVGGKQQETKINCGINMVKSRNM
jgi:hypothetical protein